MVIQKEYVFPKALLDQCGFKESITLTVKDHTLIIAAYDESPRKGWESKAKQMAKQGDDALLDEPILDHAWDENEWEW